MWPLERCPGRRNEVAPFCPWDDKPEAFSCAGHRRTRIGHRNRGRRGIGNYLQQPAGSGRERSNQLCRHIGRSCQHETVHRQGRAVSENDIIHPTTELMGSHTQSVNGTTSFERDALVCQSLDEGGDQIRQPVLETDEHRTFLIGVRGG